MRGPSERMMTLASHAPIDGYAWTSCPWVLFSFESLLYQDRKFSLTETSFDLLKYIMFGNGHFFY